MGGVFLYICKPVSSDHARRADRMKKGVFLKMNMKTKQLALDAMFAAMVFALGYFSIDLVGFKFTFEGLPIVLGAMLFGPVDGMLIAFVGILITQLLKYGITATTLLWILPHVVSGGFVGYFAMKKKFRLSYAEAVILLVISQILVTLINSVSIAIDAKIYGYYYPTIITGMLATRLVITVIKGVAYGLVLPQLTRILSRQLHFDGLRL